MLKLTETRVQATGFPPLRRRRTRILQVNLGCRCNQACVHCHVNAGPLRTEMMDEGTIRLIVPALRSLSAHTLDLTGGAPELHPQFRDLVHEARAAGIEVVDHAYMDLLRLKFEPANLEEVMVLSTIHTYPTMLEANKCAAGEWKRAHAPQAILAGLAKYHSWRRG